MLASSTKLVCLFFLLTTLQIHARDSQFFSKVTRNRDYTTSLNNNYLYNNQDEENQPSNIIPQNTQGSFGLYGHDTGLDPPTTTSTSTRANPTTLYNMDDNNYENSKIYNNNNDNNNYQYNENNQEEEGYEPKLEGLSETSYTNINNNVPWKYAAENNYKNHHKYNNNYNNNNNNNNNNHGDEGKYYGGVGYNGGVEKQGMSDTRYLENGKYFYDISAEKNLNNDFSYKSNNYLKNNNNGKFYGNNYNNNYNKYYNENGMQQGFNSQFSQDEFDFDDQP